ncbi:hypothetical protein QTQ03_16625 [Micromonospora sp. WMMA1363]|uniref:hypothetical protein n=1 Tax=Micromonospora sp. WMMA1363 TaxID=3053985 RepID=UPI00259CF39E|nr:hypothetical protein [Micromonospora sp. WMMA1363]MDM4721144.1 hypothetical protein [Micromonospora sp. WMMA1363]
MTRRVATGIAMVIAVGGSLMGCGIGADDPGTPTADVVETSSSPEASPERLRVAALMDRAGCDGSVIGTQLYSYETGRCDLGGSTVTIAVFESEQQRDEWVRVGGEFGGTVVVGGGWAAFAEHPEAADALAGSLSGAVR